MSWVMVGHAISCIYHHLLSLVFGLRPLSIAIVVIMPLKDRYLESSSRSREGHKNNEFLRL